jgi:rhodanese-related sulfurtransferase
LKTLLALLLAASFATVSVAQPAPAASAASAPVYKAKSPKLTRAQLDALLAQPESVLLIDVRRPDEVSAIGGFPAYLSIQAKDLEQYLAFIPRDRAIVALSNHAGRGGAAADLLASKGFKVAGAVGVQDYEAEGGTLLRIKPPVAAAVATAAAAATAGH